MTKIAVIGAGVMGCGIAQSLAQGGYDVSCQDVSPAQLEQAQHLAVHGRYGIDRAVERGKLTVEQAADALKRLVFTASFDEAVEDADLVIESVPEDIGLKVSLFRRLDEAAPSRAVLASNTSGLPIAALAASTERPDRVIGWHFASPVPASRFSEIAVTPLTAESTTRLVCEVATACGKSPIVVKENPTVWGLVANRVMRPMILEAHRVVTEGLATPEQVDQLLRDGFGWPVGPFAMGAGAAEGWGDGRDSSIKAIGSVG